MSNNQISNFKKELKALLIKYNASISFSCGESSDWSGLCEEEMTASIGAEYIVLCNGSDIYQEDIK